MLENHSTLIPASTVSYLSCYDNKPVVAGLNFMHYLNKSLANIDGEEWKGVVGYDGLYEVSNLGRLKMNGRRVPIHGGFTRFRNPKIKTQFIDIGGYCTTGLSNGSKSVSRKVHVLVATAFIPNPENKPHVNHKDGVKHNNNVDNLEWVTRNENMQHAYSNNLINTSKGEKHLLAKFKDSDVLEIFNSFDSAQELADRYNVKIRTIYAIKEGSNWSHLTGKICIRKKRNTCH